MPALTLERLMYLASQAMFKTQSIFEIGSNNISDEAKKTGYWSEDTIATIRQASMWVKTDEMRWVQEFYDLDEVAADFGKELGSDDLKETETKLSISAITIARAQRAARAIEVRSGNCGEMTTVAAYFLSEYLMNDQDAVVDLLAGEIEISRVSLPEPPYDHTFLEIKLGDTRLFIDPWIPLPDSQGAISSSLTHHIHKIRNTLFKEYVYNASMDRADEYEEPLNKLKAFLYTVLDNHKRHNMDLKLEGKAMESPDDYLLRIKEFIMRIEQILNYSQHRPSIANLFEKTPKINELYEVIAHYLESLTAESIRTKSSELIIDNLNSFRDTIENINDKFKAGLYKKSIAFEPESFLANNTYEKLSIEKYVNSCLNIKDFIKTLFDACINEMNSKKIYTTKDAKILAAAKKSHKLFFEKIDLLKEHDLKARLRPVGSPESKVKNLAYLEEGKPVRPGSESKTVITQAKKTPDVPLAASTPTAQKIKK